MQNKQPGALDFISRFYQFLIGLIDRPYTISFAAALFTITMFLRFFWPHLSELKLQQNDYDNIQQSIQWFGILYGLLIPLLLVHMQTQFTETQRSFDREAGLVFVIHKTFLLFHNLKLEEEVKINIVNFIDHVKNHYDEEYDKKKRELKDAGDVYLDNIRKLIGWLILTKEDQVLTSEVLRLINDLMEARRNRLSYTKQVSTDILFALSVISSIYFFVPFLFLNFDTLIVKLAYIGGTTFIIILILQIVYDLWELFGGIWQINLEAWDELRNHIVSPR